VSLMRFESVGLGTDDPERFGVSILRLSDARAVVWGIGDFVKRFQRWKRSLFLDALVAKHIQPWTNTWIMYD